MPSIITNILNKNIMKKLFIYILCLASAFACEQLPEDVQIYGLGCKVKEVALTSAAGAYSLDVYADGDFVAELEEDVAWLRFSEAQDSTKLVKSGDAAIGFSFGVNRGLPRTTVLTLTRGTNVVEVTFVQDGLLEDGVQIEQKNVSVPAEGGQIGAKISTKLRKEDLSFEVNYKESDDKDWIDRVDVKNNFIMFDVKANLTENIRHADVSVIYSGGIGSVQITQFCSGSIMQEVQVSGLKALLDAEGEVIVDSHIVLEGVVLNDNLEGNGAENRIISVDNNDMTYADRILYVQSEDGADGIKLIFSKSCADKVNRYDRISLDTYGLTLKREDNPVRYSIARIPSEALVATMAGDAPHEKVRTLGELTDNDIYTLVTVPDVEIPVRKGSFAPIDIRNINLMSAYPMVIRDKLGGTSHMMVNVNCPWSRDGNSLPQGSGSVTGVVVHEKCDNFEWDSKKEKELSKTQQTAYITGLGTIGNYQIRPVSRGEVRISENEGFSTLMYEWAYCDSLGVNLVKNYEKNTMYPTYSSVDESLPADAEFYCMGGDGKVALRLCNDFTHLGPYIYGGEITDPSNGNGIVDSQNRSAHWDPYPTTNTIGVIYSYYAKDGKNKWSSESNGGNGSNGSAWCIPGWDKKDGQYWCAEFSTKNLSSANSPLNLTFGTMNHIESLGAPRYWKVQCRVDGKEWQSVCEYSVPDFVYSKGPRVYQLPGTKYITVNLPDSMLSMEKVYVRLIPDGDKLLAATTDSYSGTDKITTDSYNAINYFAIRYNK